MYLHLGQDVLVKTDTIIGIFDLENSTVSGITRKYLSSAEKAGRVVNVSLEMPKTFIVCSDSSRGDKKRNIKVYISQISAATLKKRSHFMEELSQ